MVHELLVREEAPWSEFWRRGLHRAIKRFFSNNLTVGEERKMEKLIARLMVACFVASMALAPVTLLAGGAEKKAEGQTTSSDKDKKAEDSKDKEKKGAN